MKQLSKWLVLILLCLPLGARAQISSDYDPNNPPEPQNLFALTLKMNIPGAGSVSGAGTFAEGSQPRPYVSTNSGYRFLYWKENDNVVSTSYAFYYSMPARPVALTAYWEWDPSVPTEPTPVNPRKKVTFLMEPAGAGYYSYDSYENPIGTNFNNTAYWHSGYAFEGWYSADTLITTNRTLSFQVKDRDVTVTGRYRWEPGAPGEPQSGNTVLYYLSTFTQEIEKNKTIAYPVHLLNQNIAFNRVEFNIYFPQGISVDWNNCALTSRQNGHILAVDTLGNNGYNIIVSEAMQSPLFGSSGILLTIPITLVADWPAGSSWPVAIADGGSYSGDNFHIMGAKNGSLVMRGSTTSLYASFFPDQFLNRVYFRNLSSSDAQSFAWDFGDGAVSSDQHPLHSFDEAGTYQVKLKVTRDEEVDSIFQTVIIADPLSWKVSGNLSLDANKNGAKNFHNPEALFELLSRAQITGEVVVQTAAQQPFSFVMNTVNTPIVETLAGKLEVSSHPLRFVNSSLQTAKIDFSGDLSQEQMNTLLRLWKRMLMEGVGTSFKGADFDLNALNTFADRLACTNVPTDIIDFRTISADVLFAWQLVTDTTSTVSGYLESGEDFIPSMTLINDANKSQTIIYQLRTRGASNYLWKEVKVVVRPDLKGVVQLTRPINNFKNSNLSVYFEWSPVPDALYNLFVWEKGSEQPTEPLLARLTQSNVTNSSFVKYGKSYYWLVEARGPCNSIQSAVDSFTVRTLPDLQVTDFEYPAEMYAADEIVVRMTVTNFGGDAPSQWTRDELHIARNAALQNLQLLATVNAWRTVAAGASYQVDFNVKLPTDTIPYTRFVGTTDTGNSQLEINEQNNRSVSDSMTIVQPLIDECDYALLRLLHDRLEGPNWKQRWNTSTRIMMAANWPGVTFRRGVVTGLSLRANRLAGPIPKELFNFPSLKQLDLYDNRLSADLSAIDDSIRSLAVKCDSLQLLNLGKNYIKGEFADFVDCFPLLTDLNLSGNTLHELSRPLSTHITALNLNDLVLPTDSMDLTPLPVLRLSTVSRYNHSAQNFNLNPSFTIYRDNNYLGYIRISSGAYELNWWDADGWKGHSGELLRLRQDNGVAAGSWSPFKLYFIMGDANIDRTIDLLDVQHSVNHILRERPKPYNFRAGDVYTDNSITVQDIVITVNMILEADTTTIQGAPMKAPAADCPNYLYIDKGQLMLQSDVDFAALDISIEGVAGRHLRLFLSNDHFQWISKDRDGGTRLIIFSTTGAVIPAGTTRLAELSLPATLQSVKAVDRQALSVPCRIQSMSTGIPGTEEQMLQAWINNQQLIIRPGTTLTQVDLKLYTVGGQLLLHESYEQLTPQLHTLPLRSLPPGVYFLQVRSARQSAHSYKLTLTK